MRRRITAVNLAMAAVVSATAADRRLSVDPAPAAAAATQTIAAPARRAADPPPDRPPVLVPAAARIDPMTIEVAIAREPAPGAALRHTISRTADRLHIGGGDPAREWLFEQNPVDPRRASGASIDHGARTIVLHAESDLRVLMGIRGWADVVLLGFDIEGLARYTPTRESQMIGGVRFIRYVAAPGAAPPASLWWSDHHLLARDVVAADPAGRTRRTILDIRAGIDRSLIEPAALRFPAYRVMSVADWLEHRVLEGDAFRQILDTARK